MSVPPPAPWTTAWPAGLGLLMALGGLWCLRSQLRRQLDRRMVLLLLGYLLVRCLLLPVWRHSYDGHEAEYLDLLMGRKELTRGGPMLYPAMQWWYWGVGKLLRHELVPLLLSLAASVAGALFWLGSLERLLHRRVVLPAGLGLALWGSHAAWSSSAYNVILPWAACGASLWGLACWIDGRAPRAGAALCAGAGVLAAATRAESALIAPTMLFLLIWRRPRGWVPWIFVLFGASLAALAIQLVLFPGEVPGEEQRGLAWSLHRDLWIYWEPLQRPWVLAPLLLGWVRLLRQRLADPGVLLSLLMLPLLCHLLGASFEDYGFRHVLLGGLPLMLGLSGLWSWRALRWLTLLPLAGLGWELLDTRERFYASESDFAATLAADLPALSLEEVQRCSLICEDGRVLPEAEQRSHFNLLSPSEEQAIRSERGCIYWIYGTQDHRWSSRAVRDRALRLEALFRWEDRGVLRLEEQDFTGWVRELKERRP